MNRIFSLTRMPIAPIWGESVLASRLLIHYWFTSSATIKTPQDDKSCLQWRLQGKGREQRWRYKSCSGRNIASRWPIAVIPMLM